MKNKEAEGHHLWGVLKNGNGFYYNTWQYVRPCTADRRALIGIDPRKYAQLEVRKTDGTTVLSFTKETEIE